MDATYKQRASRAAFERRAGTEDAAQKRTAANNAATDWWTNCPGCKKRRTGSLAELRNPCECGHG